MGLHIYKHSTVKFTEHRRGQFELSMHISAKQLSDAIHLEVSAARLLPKQLVVAEFIGTPAVLLSDGLYYVPLLANQSRRISREPFSGATGRFLWP